MKNDYILSWSQICELGFPFTKFKWFDEVGEFEGILLEKSWGKSQNLTLYVELMDETHRWIRFSTYQQRNYYMGLKTVPHGTVIRFRFERSARGSRSNIASWEAIGTIPDEELCARFAPTDEDAFDEEEWLEEVSGENEQEG